MPGIPVDPDNPDSLLEFVEQLNEDQLRTLNQLVVARLKSIQQSRQDSLMSRFKVGDAVSFTDKHGVIQSATVIRLNKKTASLVTQKGERWNVAPGLLEHEDTYSESIDSGIPPGGRPTPGLTVVDGGLPGSGVIEWAGGIARFPGRYIGEDRASRPDAIIWLDPDGLVRGMDVCEPGDIARQAKACLDRAIASPLTGQPQVPTRIRVADQQLADRLAVLYPDINLVHAPTPELDVFMQAMLEDSDNDGEAPTYLSQNLEKRAVAFLFDAAANLHKAAPWKKVPHDECLFGVSVPAIGIDQHVFCVIGQMEQDYGIVLFESAEDYNRYLLAGDCLRRGVEFDMPGHRSLNFENGSELGPELRKEISENAWRVAGATAYPRLVASEHNLVMRPLDEADLTLFEAIARALPKMLAGNKALPAAWAGGEPVHRTIQVKTHRGELDVELSAPDVQQGVVLADESIIRKLTRMGRTSSEINESDHKKLAHELEQLFKESREAEDLDGDVSNIWLLMDSASTFFGDTIATLMPMDLEEILYGIIPGKVMVGPSEAESMVAQFRAFYAFLKREYSLLQADACIEILGPESVAPLQAAMSDDSMAGMAKSILSRGAAAGFDMESKAGIEEYLRTSQDEALPGLFDYGDPPAPNVKPDTPKQKRARKKKRKATRKARKKNR